MKTATFSCPHCLSPLRIRDRAFTERKIDCPECGEALEITLDRDNEPRARKAEESAAPKRRKTSRPMPPRRTSRRKKKSQAEENRASAKTLPKLNQKPLFDIGGRLPEVFTSPVGIAWAVAALVAILLGILAWPQSGADAPQENPDEEQIASVEPVETEADTDLEIPGPDVKPAENEADSPAIRKRLESLGGIILLSP